MQQEQELYESSKTSDGRHRMVQQEQELYKSSKTSEGRHRSAAKHLD